MGSRLEALRAQLAETPPHKLRAYAAACTGDERRLLDQLLSEITNRPMAGVAGFFCRRPECDGLPHEGWEFKHARAAQNPPDGDWLVWLILAGRGFGKSRTGAEFVAQWLQRFPGHRAALVGATWADGRDVMVEGEAGVLKCLPPSALVGGSTERSWNRSLGELMLANGSHGKLFTSERPRQLRGPSHHVAWGDEPFHWKDAHRGVTEDSTYSNLVFGLRLGLRPRVVLTSTPKRVKLLRGEPGNPGILGQPDTVVTRGITHDNIDNLAPSFARQIIERYEGTRLGRQELYAELLDDVEGALWTAATIEQHRVRTAPHLVRVVVGVDPAVTSKATSDETGIIVVGRSEAGEFYVLDDRSLRASPEMWAKAVVGAYEDHEADRVIAEQNQGYELVEHLLRTVAPGLPIRRVTASRGKQTRAEPASALYEQGKVHHVGLFVELEEQMTGWVPLSGDPSPDRMDALVWALRELEGPAPSSSTAARMRIPSVLR